MWYNYLNYKSEFVVIIMLFKEINKRDFDKLALKMFSILSSNMEIINSKETISDDDFSIWLKYQNDHFYEKVFIIFEDGDTLAGYFQYSLSILQVLCKYKIVQKNLFKWTELNSVRFYVIRKISNCQ